MNACTHPRQDRVTVDERTDGWICIDCGALMDADDSTLVLMSDTCEETP
jgi:hypothetical protein